MPRIKDLTPIIEMVLRRYKAAVTIINDERLTPFYIAIEEENAEAFQVLFSDGEFDKNFQQKLLCLAREKGKSQIVHYYT